MSDLQGFLTLVAATISAIAALGALVVSYLNYRSQQPSVDVMWVASEHGYNLRVANVGGRRLSVTEIGIQWRLPSQGDPLPEYNYYEFDSPMPHALAPGEANTWLMEWNELARGIATWTPATGRPASRELPFAYVDIGVDRRFFDLNRLPDLQRTNLLEKIEHHRSEDGGARGR